jgi:cell division protein FtsN
MATRRGKQATRGGKPPLPAWMWLGIGVLLGLALAAVVLVRDWAPMLRKRDVPMPNPEASAPRESETPVAEARPKKTFDFYQVLPEMEVVIPDAEISAKARAEQQARAAQSPPPTSPATAPVSAAPGTGVRYVLQVGSTPDPQGAEALKARLALLGFVATIQPVNINGKTWNRIRLGPYASASELEDAKRTLAGQGISATALKETGGG